MRFLTIASVVVAGLATDLSAACRKAVVTKVVVEQVAAVQYVPVLVPTYALSYQPPAPLREAVTEEDPLVREVRLLREELRAARGLPEKIPEPQTVTLGRLLAAKCIKCHAGPEPKAGLLLVDAKGNLPVLSVAERQRIVRRVSARSMPPKEAGVLSESEIKVLVDGLK